MLKLTKKMYDPDDFKEGVNFCNVEISTNSKGSNSKKIRPKVLACFSSLYMALNPHLLPNGEGGNFKAVAIKRTLYNCDEYNFDPNSEPAIEHHVTFIIEVGERRYFLIKTVNFIWDSGKTEQFASKALFAGLYYSINSHLLSHRDCFFVSTDSGIHIMSNDDKEVGLLMVENDDIVIRGLFNTIYGGIVSPWDINLRSVFNDFGPLQLLWNFESDIYFRPKNLTISKEVTYCNEDLVKRIISIYNYFSETIACCVVPLRPEFAHEIYEQIVKIREKTPPRRRIVGNNP